jgi:hypothetical protein
MMDVNDRAADGPPPDAGVTPASQLLTALHARRLAPAASPAAPFTLGQYQVFEKIGHGGMGAVYRALHLRLKKPVAVKILPPDRVGDPQAVARFEREMEAVGRLNHDHIVRATDAGEANGVHFLVMELIDGIDLGRLVQLRGPLPLAAACEIVRQAAVGLQYAHEHELVHRDVKPSNLLLSSAGQVKVLDLGLALLRPGMLASGELTLDGQPMGTADYMAPEQWDDSHAVDIRADIYSLGCTLHKLLTGRPPFDGPKHGSLVRKMAAHVGERVRRVAEERGDVPPAVEELLTRMMAKDPADRPSTPAAVAQALAPFCGDAGLATLAGEALTRLRTAAPAAPEAVREAASLAEPTPPGGRTLTQSRLVRPRRRYLWAAAVTAGFVLLATAAVLFWRPWEGSASDSPPVGVWQNLLTKPPGKTLWIDQADSRLDHNPQKAILWINNRTPALLRLGETKARGYQLQVGFKDQGIWKGRFGVYLGGQHASGPDFFHCQVIVLYPGPPLGGPPTFTLDRSAATFHRDQPDGRPTMNTSGVASATLKDPLDSSEQKLDLEVTAHGKVIVKWQGRPYPDLGSEKAEELARQYHQAEQRGEFGIFCDGTSITVTTAQFMVTEP